jgi:antitoxin MazE
MATVVKTRLVKIGNSRGIRIPKVWIEHLGLKEEVVMTVEPDKLVIRPAQCARENWEERFRAMAEQHDDALLDEEITTNWDGEEWEW